MADLHVSASASRAVKWSVTKYKKDNDFLPFPFTMMMGKLGGQSVLDYNAFHFLFIST